MNHSPKENKQISQPLQIKSRDGLLTISIGIERLAYCQQVVIDNELEKEREDGSTIFTDLLDAASRRAVENGSIAVRYIKKKPYTWLNHAEKMLKLKEKHE